MFTALTRERITPDLDRAATAVLARLSDQTLAGIRDEHQELFINPYAQYPLATTASHYMDGRHYGRTLVACRELLKQARLLPGQDIDEPEDSLLLMLDALVTLVDEEKKGVPTMEPQHRLLKRFLLPTARSMLNAARDNQRADFYQVVLTFLVAYLDMEEMLAESRPSSPDDEPSPAGPSTGTTRNLFDKEERHGA